MLLRRGGLEPPRAHCLGHTGVVAIGLRRIIYREFPDRLIESRAVPHVSRDQRRVGEAVHAAGLERGQYQLMLAVKGIPQGVRPRIRELANRMQIQHHSAVELINRLERGGYIRRERAQDDRREVLLALTPKGERVLGELALHHHEELQSAAPSLVTALRKLMRSGKDGSDAQPEARQRRHKPRAKALM